MLLAISAELVAATGIGVALPDVAGSFGASPDETSWVLTLYLVGFTVVLPLTPYLCDTLGQRLYLGASILAYMLATVGCACSSSLEMLLVMRTVAGAAGAVFLVRYVVTVRSRLDAKSRPKALLLIVLPFFVRGATPVAAGYLTEALSWRWIFLVSLPLSGSALAALCFSTETWHRRRRLLPDPTGLVLLICGIGGLCVLLSRGQIDDWFGNRLLGLLAIIAVVALPIFIWHQHRDGNHRHLIRLGSLTHRGVIPGLFFAGLFGFSLQGGLYLLPQFLRSIGRNDAISAGWMFGIDTISTAVALIVVATGVVRFPSRKWLLAAGALFTASMLLFAFRQTSATPNESLWLPLMLRGAAMAAAFLPLPDLMFRDVASVSFNRLAEARALYYTVRQLGGVAGVAALAWLLDQREAVNSTHLTQRMSAVDINTQIAMSRIGQGLAARGLTPAQTATGAKVVVNRLLMREAAVLSYQDIFLVLAVIGGGMCITALFFRKVVRAVPVSQGASAQIPGSLEIMPIENPAALTPQPIPLISNSQEVGKSDPAKAGNQPIHPRHRADRIRLTRVALASLVVITVVGMAGAVGYYWLPSLRGLETTDDAYIDGHVVNAAPQVAGRVTQVLVDDNQPVEPNQLLLRIDDADYLAKVQQSQAAMDQTQGQMDQSKAQLRVARATAAQLHAQVRVAKANSTKATADLQRYQHLSVDALPKLTLDTATAAVEVTNAQTEAAEQTALGADAQVEVAQTAIATAQSAVEAARATHALAELNLSYCDLRSPIAGFVTRKTVEVGNYATIGQPLLVIVPRKVFVTANFKETQLASMRPGQLVTIWVDAYPSVKFTGHVDSQMVGTGSAFSLLPPENATGNYVKVVQRVPVKITIDGDNNDPSHRLAPGMSVVPWVNIRSAPTTGNR
jgi:membrane fusion protein (multidrug efflux system)